MGVEKRGDWVGAGENEQVEECGVFKVRLDRMGDLRMTVRESNSTLFSASDSVDLSHDLLCDLRRLSIKAIMLVNSDAAVILF